MPGRVSQSFLVVVLMLGMNVPVVEAQSDVVASALRRASGVEVARETETAQEGSVIRRRRSGAMAGFGCRGRSCWTRIVPEATKVRLYR